MCGIGFISTVKDSTIDVPLLTQALLRKLQARGKDASGYGWRDANGDTWYAKSPVAGGTQATKMRKDQTMLPGARASIVHTRFATLGDPRVEGNNHPIIRPGVMLVHNGHIRDHREAFAKYKYTRDAQVDSEIIAAIVERTPNTLDALGRLSILQGTAAVAWIENGNQALGEVHVARISGSPLVIAQTEEGDTVGASTETLLRSACALAGVKLDWVCHLLPGTYLRVVDGVIADWHRFPVAIMPTTRPDYTRPSAFSGKRS